MGAPSGTVTFLFTDIETSTALWESDPDSMRVALEGHDEALRAAVDAHGGTVFGTGGDGFAVAFARFPTQAAVLSMRPSIVAVVVPERAPSVGVGTRRRAGPSTGCKEQDPASRRPTGGVSR